MMSISVRGVREGVRSTTKLSVRAAFAGRRVLITGATGFIAKVVMEKLIRDVPGIGGFVLLVRGSRAHPDATERFYAEVLGSSAFDRLRERNALWLQRLVEQKVRVLRGDITEPDLGLSQDEFKKLAGGIDIIVNVAASVNFREQIDRALAVNTFSLLHLAKLARVAGGIPFVQVSTCYVNGYRRGRIDETIEAPAGLKLPRHADGYFEVDGLLEHLRRAVTAVKQRVQEPQAQSHALVALGVREARRHGWNDIYTFTKWLGEQLICRQTRGGTLTIVRPSIVESACREPQPGWIEGVKVGDAIVLAYARGKVHIFPARPAGVIDIIPVDLVANSIILAAAEALVRPHVRHVYQASSSTCNPICLGHYIRLCQSEMCENGTAYPRLIRKPLTRPFRTAPRVLFLASLLAAHAIMRVVGVLSRWFGKGMRCKALERMRELTTLFSFYTSPHCEFDNQNLLALSARFDDADRKRFEIDPRCFDWEHYVARVHLPGLERYGVKGTSGEPS